MPFLREKEEHFEIEYTLRGDHHDLSHVPRTYVSLPPSTNLPAGASYVNPNTLEHDAPYPSPYTTQWVLDEGRSPLSHEEYPEESQEPFPPYVFGGFYGSFPPQEPVFAPMPATPIGTMHFGGPW